MLLRRFYDAPLAQASYLIGCQRTGEALVVDPNRDIEQYMAAAQEERLAIRYVTETHIHADFVSGARELAERTGALLLLSREGGEAWQYEYASAAGARLVGDGDAFTVGGIRLDVLHTPGHTPEHLAFVVTDTAAADAPVGMLTGDFVFAGDVGRPDLLERAARAAGTMEESARALFHSLRRLDEFPAYLQLWPGHGAGSACGKALGAIPQTTLGYERIANWALAASDEARFVAAALDGQPEPPRYFAEMKRINREGPRSLGAWSEPPRLPPSQLAAVLGRGDPVVDTRSELAFAAGHVPGTINIPAGRSFSTWAGWLLPYSADIHLIVEGEGAAASVTRSLAMIGLDRVAGYFGVDAVRAWADEGGRELLRVPQMSVAALAARWPSGELAVIDVRGRSEWEAGHLPGVENIPLGYLTDSIRELPRDRPLVLHCQGGGRSAIGASVLRARGLTNVVNLEGGFAAWMAAGQPIESAPAGAWPASQAS